VRKDNVGSQIADLEAELDAIINWRNLPPHLREQLFARLAAVKAQAVLLKRAG
jgi:hypothetical protein